MISTIGGHDFLLCAQNGSSVYVAYADFFLTLANPGHGTALKALHATAVDVCDVGRWQVT